MIYCLKSETEKRLLLASKVVSNETAVEQTQRRRQWVSENRKKKIAHLNVRDEAEEGERLRQKDTRLILPDVDASL